MKNIVEELSRRGHAITVITNSASPTVADNSTTASYRFEILQVPHSKEQFNEMMDEILRYWTYDMPNDNIIQAVLKMKPLMETSMEFNMATARTLFSNTDLLERLKTEQYDVILSDPLTIGFEYLAEQLDIPFVLSLRFSFAHTMERLCGQVPSPHSYVPAPGLSYTDQMDFTQRLKNTLFYLSQDIVFHLVAKMTLDVFYSELSGKPTSLCEMIGKADIWLIRTYWDFEYPRPFLPNFKFVGGLHCKPAKPLPTDIEEFVQSSGDDGIVVFSLGSMIKNLTKERGNTIATALGQIPQKVLWRYSGEKPDTIAPNTRLYDWIPQNDLLGHTKTKAFITHGGTNGLYEAIYHGIPMVGIPLFADQPDNMMHMKSKGAAVMMDFNKLQSKDLVEGLNAVINDPSYKENMMKLSRIHHDQPMRPLDTAVFWIEFVMRNKGAKHLRVQAHNLTWYQYYCLDVAAFLLSVVGLILVLLIKTCCFCIRKCCGKGKPREKTD
ncbi:UDP-glucuronosyltransferase 2C1-like isoform X2 [Osmerus mordax]|uniref:UDP-glucuronosyltransferase 2C1-like isoform X2 n=1 Tax=Osmerus mordax TaxID=8014 RepID=UPI003510B0A3